MDTKITRNRRKKKQPPLHYLSVETAVSKNLYISSESQNNLVAILVAFLGRSVTKLFPAVFLIPAIGLVWNGHFNYLYDVCRSKNIIQVYMDDMKEFIAYSRKLLRSLDKIEKALEAGDIGKALELVRELKEDTQKDIEA